MFTGIVQALGTIEAIETQQQAVRMLISCGGLDCADLINGDSIAVNGVCLTIADSDEHGIHVDISAETLSCTTLSGLEPGYHVNLEKALLPTMPIGGHFVSGHVDDVGVVNDIVDEGRSVRMRIAIPVRLARYIAPKGSVCVDGVSLTVNDVRDSEFTVNIIPHTRTSTILGEYTSGTTVNIEVDLIARYLERLLDAAHEREHPESTITQAFLVEHGYIKKPDIS